MNILKINSIHCLITFIFLMEALAINCPKKCNNCLKKDLSNCTEAINNELSIEVFPNEIVISCSGNFSSINNEDVISFDASYLIKLDDLATMTRKCYKTKARKIKYLINIDNIEQISLTKDILDFSKNIEYFKYAQATINKETQVNIENDFFKNASDLKIIIITNLKMNKLNFNQFPGSVEYLYLALNGVEYIEQGNKSFDNILSLDLSGNKLQNISKSTFSNMKNLKYLKLKMNQIRTIDYEAFKETPMLEDLDLSQNPLEDLLFDMPNLKKLKLNGCKLTNIPKNIFSKSYNLNYLDMSNNHINYLEEETFLSLSNLTLINLSFNNLQVFPENLFKNTINLKTINFSYNKLMVIDTEMFLSAQKLETLDLSYNEVCNFSNTLSGFTAKNLSLKHNKIDDFAADLIYNTVLRNLDLSYNSIKTVNLEKDYIPKNRYIEVYLSHNQINELNITQSKTSENWMVMIDLSENQLKCNCLGYFLEKIPHFDNQTIVMNITSQENICYSSYPNYNCPLISIKNCPEKCHCSYSRIHNAVIVNCSFRNLARYPELKELFTDRYEQNQTFLMLNGNKLDIDGQELLETYWNVTRLDLADNRINELKWLPKNLKMLDLTNNSLTTLTPKAITYLKENKNLHKVSLKHNPWKCDCNAVDFRNYLMDNEDTYEKSEVICQDTLKQLIYTEVCDHTVGIVLGLSTSIAFVFVVLSALYFKYTDTIKVYLYSKNLCLWWVAEEEIDKDKTWDVFISYSHKDEDLVINELLPELEHGEPSFKVCYHHRDWVPGEFITTQIANSVLDSRRTLVVLSNSFMDSVWGKMEFRAAHTQAINDGRVRVIVVIYGELDESNLGEEMNMYLKTNTYIKWGDPWFWNKLKYALPHSKHRSHHVSLEGVNTVDNSQVSFHLR